ncbi:hypothetical protein IP83_04190 [Novosphingobium sp. AAP93]|nr:hypothetical protein IP83_04190 [Novosphingobium sp. AAP93]
MPIAQIDEAHLLKMTKVNYFGTVWFVQAVAHSGRYIELDLHITHSDHPFRIPIPRLPTSRDARGK